GPLRLRELPDPAPPGPGWLVLEPRHTGICGSDVTQATLQADWDNPLSGLVSFPHVMGHEVVASLLEPAGSDLAPGETVVLNPWLGCAARGLSPCPECSDGMLPLCAHGGEPIPGGGAGIHTGNIRGLPGGMGTLMVAHHSQLRRLPDGLDPRAGVLADPVAVGLHAGERALGGHHHSSDLPIVVFGAGTIGLSVAAGLRHLGARSVLVSAAWAYQPALARAVGAQAISARPQAVVREVAARTGGRLSRPWRGLPWLVSGGAAAVIDAVGSSATSELALAIVRPGGTVVRVGVGRARRQQATLTYFKEVSVVGSNGYRRRDFDTALEMLGRDEVPWREWLTHRAALGRWRDAFRIAAEPERHAAVKVSLDIGAAKRTSEATPAEERCD
ncbi:MAG: zinc-binding dehydrogenase, partial [Candidatus Dormiibacterota bacterium]